MPDFFNGTHKRIAPPIEIQVDRFVLIVAEKIKPDVGIFFIPERLFKCRHHLDKFEFPSVGDKRIGQSYFLTSFVLFYPRKLGRGGERFDYEKAHICRRQFFEALFTHAFGKVKMVYGALEYFVAVLGNDSAQNTQLNSFFGKRQCRRFGQLCAKLDAALSYCLCQLAWCTRACSHDDKRLFYDCSGIDMRWKKEKEKEKEKSLFVAQSKKKTKDGQNDLWVLLLFLSRDLCLWVIFLKNYWTGNYFHISGVNTPSSKKTKNWCRRVLESSHFSMSEIPVSRTGGY